jgi:tetratricopeptide (TPR) repeat protein
VPRLLDPTVLQGDIEAAREHFQLGRPMTSLRRLKAIRNRIERTHDGRAELRRLVARILVSQASAHYEVTGDLQAALDMLTDAERVAATAGNPGDVAPIRGQRGLLLLRSGMTSQAMVALDDAAAVMADADLSDRTFILLNRGVLHLERGNLDLAEKDFAGCLEVATRAGDEVRQSAARHNLGYLDFLAGRIPRALALIEEAAMPHPVTMLDRARVLREAGLTSDADRILERAAATYAEARLVQELAETEVLRAECALVERDPQDARALAASAVRRFARRGNVRWQRRAELLMLRCERFAADDREPRSRRTALRGVAARAAALAERCRTEGRRDLARTADLLASECRLLAGDPLDAPLPPLRSGDTLQTRLHLREVRALAAMAAGEHARAAGEVRRGLGELGAYQHSFGSLDLRTASAVHGAALAGVGLEVALDSGSPAAVLHLVEQARAVSTRLPEVRPPRDERTAQLLTDLRRVEEETRALEGDPMAVERLEELRDCAAALQRSIRARAWEIEGDDGSATAAPRLSEVRAAARDAGVAFVTYARSHGRWVAVCVCGTRAVVHDLASMTEVGDLVRRVHADLDALAMPLLPPPLRATVRQSLDKSLHRLDALLLAPLRLGDKGATLSCSGDLVFLPWGLLPSRLGLPTVVTPSAATWLRGRERPRPEAPRVVAVAGPDLRCAEAEAALVARTWPGGSALSPGEATVAATRSALGAADLLHIAAHGRHRQDNPLFSAVRLVDGPLYAYEIDPAAGLAGCVVLSACEAGLTTLRPGDESLGLAHVLLQLGTRSVVAGVARVGDDVSARLMDRVHTAMARGTDAALALAEAQRENVTDEAVPAFVCFGDTW